MSIYFFYFNFKLFLCFLNNDNINIHKSKNIENCEIHNEEIIVFCLECNKNYVENVFLFI